ncbi:DUF6011 domain-containing protein [Nocardia sp. NPDC057455]|uniref:DUF6011 domain-containing protein n=1 Tax=Nocardia sp. NPDC057455 TaxID=3346138 RepID=UPI0036719644
MSAADEVLDNAPDGARLVPAVECRRCKQLLISGPSFRAGIGPTCARHERTEARAAAAAAEELPLFELPSGPNGG